jgi:N utilization substance protein B
MGNRTKARARALQVLYAWELRGRTEGLRAVDRELTAPGERTLSADIRAYADRLMETIESHRDELDERIQGLAENWRLARMTTVDRNILRIAAAEMIYIDEIPLRVALHEALRLAEWFGTSESRRFINGVLDALLRELQPGRPREDHESGGGGGAGRGDHAHGGA